MVTGNGLGVTSFLEINSYTLPCIKLHDVMRQLRLDYFIIVTNAQLLCTILLLATACTCIFTTMQVLNYRRLRYSRLCTI